MKRRFKKAIAVVLTLAMAVTATGPAFAAEKTGTNDELNLQYENYVAEDGFHENGSYTINGVRYEYEQHNTVTGEIYLDVYKISNNRDVCNVREKTQEIYLSLNTGLMIANGEQFEIDINDTIVPRGPIYSNVYTGNTIIYDISRYAAEGLAVHLIAATFTGCWNVGISVALGVAITLLENYYGTCGLYYERYVTTELYPADYPGCSATHKYYCKYYDDETRVFIKQSGEHIEVVM